jgi:3-oxoacyl-[acyl-carrier protein] reductase
MAGVVARVALVTGAGSARGIGFACAKALAVAGARVAITSTTARIFERQAELGAGTHAAVAELTQPEAVADLVAGVDAALGPVEILVNNAGMVQVGRDEPSALLAEQSDEGGAYGLAINLSSAFLLTRAVLPGMRARGHGRIVQMSTAALSERACAPSPAYKKGGTAVQWIKEHTNALHLDGMCKLFL